VYSLSSFRFFFSSPELFAFPLRFFDSFIFPCMLCQFPACSFLACFQSRPGPSSTSPAAVCTFTSPFFSAGYFPAQLVHPFAQRSFRLRFSFPFLAVVGFRLTLTPTVCCLLWVRPSSFGLFWVWLFSIVFSVNKTTPLTGTPSIFSQPSPPPFFTIFPPFVFELFSQRIAVGSPTELYDLIR